MTEMSFNDRVQIWYRNKPPAQPAQFMVSINVSLPGSDVNVLPGRVLFVYERNTYVFEIGLFNKDDSFCAIELYADRLSRGIVRQQVRRVLGIRCVRGLYDELAKPKPFLQKFVPETILQSNVKLLQSSARRS